MKTTKTSVSIVSVPTDIQTYHLQSTSQNLMPASLAQIFHMWYVGMFMINLHIKFHTPSSNYSLLIAIKPNLNYKKKYLNKGHMHFQDLLCIYYDAMPSKGIMFRPGFVKISRLVSNLKWAYEQHGDLISILFYSRGKTIWNLQCRFYVTVHYFYLAYCLLQIFLSSVNICELFLDDSTWRMAAV
jgi:hypothetical protein